MVFQSLASNLAPFDSISVADISVRDRQFNQTRMVSMSSSNCLGNLDSEQASIGDDGCHFDFTSQENSPVATDTNGGYDVFLRDRDTDADGIYDESSAVSTTLVSVGLHRYLGRSWR